MDELVKLIVSSAANQGISTLLLFACVYWLNKQNQRSEAARQKERGQRFEELNGRIVALEGAVKECDADRRALRDKMIDLAAAGHLSKPASV